MPIVQSILKRSPYTVRKNLAPVTIFLGMDPTSPLSSLKRSKTCSVTDNSAEMKEIEQNMTSTKEIIKELLPIIKDELQLNRKLSREAASRGIPAKFTEGDFVLVALEEFFKGEKLALRWRGPRRVVKGVSDYVYTVEYLRNGS